MRLNVGCGTQIVDGWVNIDAHEYPGAMHCDVLDGLPFDDGTFDGAVCHHVLQMIDQHRAVDFLGELARVLQRGSHLRLSVPSLTRAIDAFYRSDREFFPVDADSIDEALCVYLSQNGATRSFYTPRVLFDALTAAGFVWSEMVEFGRSRHELGELDSRASESLIVEARR